MATKYLDYSGLEALWAKVKGNFIAKPSGSVTAGHAAVFTTSDGAFSGLADGGEVAAANHGHGNLTNGGSLVGSIPYIGTGDRLVVTDYSNASRLIATTTVFGNDSGTFLKNDGTWDTPSNGIFWATYGQTSGPEILVARSAGKLILMRYDVDAQRHLLFTMTNYWANDDALRFDCLVHTGRYSDPPVIVYSTYVPDGNANWAPVTISNLQETLVSGTNIKTVNGNSILGSGNLDLGNDASNFVQLTGDQSITGTKRFSSISVDREHFMFGPYTLSNTDTATVSIPSTANNYSTIGGLYHTEYYTFVLGGVRGLNNYAISSLSNSGVLGFYAPSVNAGFASVIYRTGSYPTYLDTICTVEDYSGTSGDPNTASWTKSTSIGRPVHYFSGVQVFDSAADFIPDVDYYIAYGIGPEKFTVPTFQHIDVSPPSGATTITFTSSTAYGNNYMPICGLVYLMDPTNASFASYRRVASVAFITYPETYQVNIFSAITYYSNNGNRISNTESNFTGTLTSLSNGNFSLTLNSGGTSTGGYFHNPGTYRLWFLPESWVTDPQYVPYQDEIDSILSRLSALESRI